MRKLFFLFSLGSMASIGPKLMPVVQSASSGDPQALMASLQQALKNQTAGGEVQIGEQELAQLQGLAAQAEAGGAPKADESELKGDIATIGQKKQALVLEKLLKDMSKAQRQAVDVKAQAETLAGQVTETYNEHAASLHFWLWALPFIVIGLGLASHAAGQAYLLRNFGEIGYTLGHLSLLFVACGTAGWAFYMHTNPWPTLPNELYMPEILLLAGSAWLMHLLDPNYPTWNNLLSGLTAPLGSMGLILVLPRVLPLLPF